MQRPQDGWKLKRDSHTVLVIWFKDGRSATFYSLDWKSKDSRFYDTQLGIERLRGLVIKYGNRANYALINLNDSESPQNRTVLEVYFEGEQQPKTKEIERMFFNRS